MDFGSLRFGNFLIIKGRKFEIIKLHWEVDPAPRSEERLRKVLCIYLHDHSELLDPTHVLKFYPDNESFVLKQNFGDPIVEKEIEIEKGKYSKD